MPDYMPYNDYVCAKSGRHFRDINAWRRCEEINDCQNCPFEYKSPEIQKREGKYRKILNAPLKKILVLVV